MFLQNSPHMTWPLDNEWPKNNEMKFELQAHGKKTYTVIEY